jgi:hypothetical protein
MRRRPGQGTFAAGFLPMQPPVRENRPPVYFVFNVCRAQPEIPASMDKESTKITKETRRHEERQSPISRSSDKPSDVCIPQKDIRRPGTVLHSANRFGSSRCGTRALCVHEMEGTPKQCPPFIQCSGIQRPSGNTDGCDPKNVVVIAPNYRAR